MREHLFINCYESFHTTDAPYLLAQERYSICQCKQRKYLTPNTRNITTQWCINIPVMLFVTHISLTHSQHLWSLESQLDTRNKRNWWRNAYNTPKEEHLDVQCDYFRHMILGTNAHKTMKCTPKIGLCISVAFSRRLRTSISHARLAFNTQ